MIMELLTALVNTAEVVLVVGSFICLALVFSGILHDPVKKEFKKDERVVKLPRGF